MDLVYACPNPSPHAAQLGPIQNVEDDYELSEGVPQGDAFPSDAQFEMDEDFGLKLDDVVRCSDGLLVVSDRLREFLEAEGLPNLEMLPVTIRDTKGRPVDDVYVVCHQAPLQDVLALDEMEVQFNPIDPETIFSVDRIVVREDALDPETLLFRFARYPDPILFERGLAEKIQEAGFTGIGFEELDAFDKYNLL